MNRRAGKIKCLGCFRMMRCRMIGAATSAAPASISGVRKVSVIPIEFEPPSHRGAEKSYQETKK